MKFREHYQGVGDHHFRFGLKKILKLSREEKKVNSTYRIVSLFSWEVQFSFFLKNKNNKTEKLNLGKNIPRLNLLSSFMGKTMKTLGGKQHFLKVNFEFLAPFQVEPTSFD